MDWPLDSSKACWTLVTSLVFFSKNDLDKWFWNHRVDQQHVEGMLKYRFLGPDPRNPDPVGLGPARYFTPRIILHFSLSLATINHTSRIAGLDRQHIQTSVLECFLKLDYWPRVYIWKKSRCCCWWSFLKKCSQQHPKHNKNTSVHTFLSSGANKREHSRSNPPRYTSNCPFQWCLLTFASVGGSLSADCPQSKRMCCRSISVTPILRINISSSLLSPVSRFQGLADGNQACLFGCPRGRWGKKGRHLTGWGQDMALNSWLVEGRQIPVLSFPISCH